MTKRSTFIGLAFASLFFAGCGDDLPLEYIDQAKTGAQVLQQDIERRVDAVTTGVQQVRDGAAKIGSGLSL